MSFARLVPCLLIAAVALGCDEGAEQDQFEAPPSTVLPSMFGTPQQSGEGTSTERYYKAAVARDGVEYLFMANGWGPGFQSQTVSHLGTAFTVDSMEGSQGGNYEPASYPTMFCGAYSDSTSGPCGLPAAISDISSLRTGWRWAANGNVGQYNAAYDIWLSNSASRGDHSAFLMIWLRDPRGQQPAGMKGATVSVANAPGVWQIWAGQAGRLPIVNYARSEGRDSPEVEVDVMDFVRDAASRNLNLPGTHILSVAVGFEIWNGPITNLQSQDFYVSVQ
jgi:hypothetical protein